MPLTQPPPSMALHFIDAPPTATALAAAESLIQADIPDTSELHPSLPTRRAIQFSDLIESEHSRLASESQKEEGIDLSRYEVPEPPSASASKEEWTAALQQAQTSAAYLSLRSTNLALLETYGRNAWLVGNSQLENELKALEREVEEGKLELEAVEQARRAIQENAEGELKGLEDGWRGGVGRMIEVLVVGERVKGEILERRRVGAAA
ncbi:hypothetical protein LTR10_001099 [Elasticomyces elasticus]|nr:hypothetical protein LTR10_001099 [Elasticomyces elasticus]KAK4965535.1 hypothetical protein LTR42_012291 [Elasticomyces elasticus]